MPDSQHGGVGKTQTILPLLLSPSTLSPAYPLLSHLFHFWPLAFEIPEIPEKLKNLEKGRKEGKEKEGKDGNHHRLLSCLFVLVHADLTATCLGLLLGHALGAAGEEWRWAHSSHKEEANIVMGREK